MTAIPLFGSLLDLPILSGNNSGCERELVELLKEVDGVVAHEQIQLINELHDFRSLCQAQQEEIETLKLALQDAGIKVPAHVGAKSHNCEAEITAKCYEQIKNLKAENTNLKKQIISVLMTIPSEELKRMNIQEIVINLQEQIQTLKVDLNKSNKDNEFLHMQHDYLWKLVEKLKNIVGKQRKGTSPLERCPDLGKHIEDLLKEAIKKSADQDQSDIKKIEEKFQNEVIMWANDFINVE